MGWVGGVVGEWVGTYLRLLPSSSSSSSLLLLLFLFFPSSVGGHRPRLCRCPSREEEEEEDEDGGLCWTVGWGGVGGWVGG